MARSAAYWSRYRTPAVCEFADALPLKLVDEATARKALADTDHWFVIDLVRKRVSTGKDVDPIGRDQVFEMNPDEKGNQSWPLSIHLPPWWELRERTTVETIDQVRAHSIDRPRPNRGVLFGEPMIEDLARRIVQVSRSGRWRDSGAVEDPKKRYPFTIEVHRDWLMTAREDLGGKTPRQMLHGGSGWIEHLIWAQRLRFEDGGKLIAAPTDVLDFNDAPMGLEEICVYFDLCREIIDSGWAWCSVVLDDTAAANKDDLSRLIDFLAETKEKWLNESFEEGSPPRFVLECSRRRVPRGSDVEIEGMDEREAEQHVSDCDCPICEMMADGMFGVGFTSIDGHHLELDDEFAFSLCETREEWEELQRGFAEFSAKMDHEQAQRESRESESGSDEFSSAWAGHVSDEPIPGDLNGHLKLAFLLAEIVSALQSRDVPRDEIKELNSSFRQFRVAEDDAREDAATHLKQCLEQIASRHGELTSRVADLQSRVDESFRHASGTTDEFPY